MDTLSPAVEAEIADILREAKSMGYTARSVLTVARHRVAVAAGRKVRTPTSAVTNLYLDALESRHGLGCGIAAVRLRQMVERLEALLRRQTDDTAERAILVGDIPEGDDILQCDIPTATEPALVQVERVVLRGAVRVSGHVYANGIALAPRHGERVQVSYEAADTARVSVKDMDGSPICEAVKLQVNAVPLAPIGAAPVTILEVVTLDVEVAGPDGTPVRPVLVVAFDPDGRLAKAAAGMAQTTRLLPLPPHRYRFPVNPGQPGRLERVLRASASVLQDIATAAVATFAGR